MSEKSGHPRGEAATHTPCAALLGEGVIWDWRNDRLLWVDAESHCYYSSEAGDPRRTSRHEVGLFVSSITLIGATGETLLLTTERGLAAVERPGGTPGFGPKRVHAISLDYDTEALRMNDAVADPLGRLWVGTMAWDGAQEAGTLYCYASPEEYSRRKERMTIPNGMGFAPEGAWFYLTDSGVGAIYRYPFTPSSAAYSEKERLPEVQPFIDVAGEEGVPDGMAVSRQGAIFSARWGAGRVVEYDSMGREIGSLPVPALQPSSCAFGGPNLSTLYVSSARSGLEEAGSEGHLFTIEGLAPGREEQVLSDTFLELLS